MERIDSDICVIGAGAGGLTVAAGASQMGATTVLVEKGLMGGDCLNYGCVPSKALIAAARAAEAVRGAHRFGVTAGPPEIDFGRVNDHVRGVIAAIAPQDSEERFQGLGVTVIRETARFTGRAEIEAGGKRITARRFVVATGSQPLVPPISGLDGVPFLTNENIFELRHAPDHLIVIGGGPIGVELAQAHRSLGSRVTIVEMFGILGRDDAELAAVVAGRLRRDGIKVLENARVTSVSGVSSGGALSVTVEREGHTVGLVGSHLLVAVGRRANLTELDLERAGIEHSAAGIAVDRRLRTSNRRVYAIGDAAVGPQFTHAAAYQAGIVLRNALFRLPARVDYRALPHVTYSQPELAQVGLSEAEVKQQQGGGRVLRWPLAENDRAHTEDERDGLIKILTNRRGRILGAGIVAPQAGELIQPWVLAIGQGLNIGAMAGLIAPYPTLGEIGKRAAGSYYAPKLFSERTRKLVRFLARFG